MSECMPIPDNWKDFVKEYSFKDIREIYTNGSWLIPTFRVEQMMEHFVKPDWISVKDRLPDDEELYLICTESNFGKIDIAYYQPIGDKFSNYEPFWQGRSSRSTRVTHWMPLPQKPESE